MNKSMLGKIALITGAGSGIGRATALLLAANGAKVIVADLDGLAADKVVDTIKADGNFAVAVNLNVAKEKSCIEVLKFAADEFGFVNVLFNNAGLLHFNDGAITNIDEKIWDMTMSVNLKGVFFMCKHSLPLMETTGGSIINAASFVALQGSADASIAYSASKGAILTLTRDLAASYAKHNIRVNSLCPGPTLTESFKLYIGENAERRDKYLASIPMRRFAEVNEIAKAVLYLASDDSSYVTGTNFIVDGGITSVYT
jgi:NAD(P)-dependent dehydrogenase (short-subunit alcohol dehydrogenase family)